MRRYDVRGQIEQIGGDSSLCGYALGNLQSGLSPSPATISGLREFDGALWQEVKHQGFAAGYGRMVR